ncbi:type II toxin-antitoxin system ParD family antitoxin [Hoeflea sp. G2-23]|jgi:antitoxin ParD1/3/4|uniref:Type II toxin-antitoxin system ParD family antitoxin n=1 Tax=Hoeflea algicola TaxID=2983763 RepID=A0ABT3Z3M3_9HYPH|nr:type II toxin-antitoxin system ParD family antitoxin [Hoeflea algicola]MCY0146326.1 type II toxin-antitoxin system ParD family antitoxin [Hoeflea algicola]
MKTLTISLSSQQIARLQKAVASGAYASNSEVMRDALRLWEQHQQLREIEINRLKRAYDEGIASGEGRVVDAKSLLTELKAERRG